MDMKIFIDGNSLNYEEFELNVCKRVPISITKTAYVNMDKSRTYIERLIERGEIAYGVTTGFGKLSELNISKEQAKQLQSNLIKSHACGVGEPLSEEIVRGMMLLRINALAKGYSGIRSSTVDMLVKLLNNGIHPIIPCQGSLGASGDLAPLAHMTLPMIGLGEVMYQGQRRKTSEVLSELDISPIQLVEKEGLSLINGTQLMCSIAALAVIKARKLLQSANIIGSLTVEALNGIPAAFHSELHRVRGQIGQIETAQHLRTLLHNSEKVSKTTRIQDAYSLRCIPQVHGATKDTLKYVANIVAIEMNAATDNPLVFPDLQQVISGGNFHGQPLALACDYLTIAMAEIANISERRTERLVNPQLSNLPAFLTNQVGVCSGYMILQYTAASLVSENKTLAHPASVDSIPTSANQEDHVSMGAIAARKCYQVLQNVTRVLAIEYICAAQAIEFGEGRLGDGTQKAYDLLRETVPPLNEDREGYIDIDSACRLIEGDELTKKTILCS